MILRRAEPRDLAAVVEIGSRAFPYIRDAVEFFLQRINKGQVVVLELGGDVVGFVDYDLDGDTILIQGLAVKEGYRGLGIGRKLLRTVEILAGYLGVGSIRLMTLEENIPARKLYESTGFEMEKREGKILWYKKEIRQ